MEMKIKHFSHPHQLILTDVLEAQIICNCCTKFISQGEQVYRCADDAWCWKNYSLHIACAELPREIMHPKHPEHSLILLSKSWGETRVCDQCGGEIEGFTYHCSLCKFDLDISCALELDLDREIERARAREGERKRDRERGMEMQMKHFGHPHQLILKDVVKGLETEIMCKCCRESISQEEQAYGCAELCAENYFLHKVCAGLPKGIMHPRHTQHPLALLWKAGACICEECCQIKKGFKYHCDECRFDLGICCALQFDYTFIDIDGERERKLERERQRERQRDRDREIERKTEKERNIGMQTKHFSHDHPLILREMLKADHEAEIMCKCCEKSISHEEQTYGCYECSKGYYLHKECAELPREILHPKHTQHSLILLSISPYPGRSVKCNECGGYSKGFTYHCSLCKFNFDISCALKDNYTLVEPRMKHNGHEHSLIFQIRPALFRCDACGVEDKDQFYQCLSCPFYIHKSCASLPITGNRGDHDHPLSLAYDLPSDYRNFEFNCGICRDTIFSQYWVYYCHACRYFVHLKCMTSKTVEQLEAEANKEDDVLDDANFEEKLLKVLLDDDLLCLPSTDLSVKMIKRFLLRKNKLANIQPEIRHFNHKEHPLILLLQNVEEIEEDEQILCNCCIEPVSAPYYSCVECGYFLHLACANLPKRLQHSTHPHSLMLDGYPEFYSTFYCDKCGMKSNGLFYKCKACDYFLDVKCAALPTSIEHQDHRHPLVQFRVSSDEHYRCNGCDYKITGLAFGCESCKFCIHFSCAMLPRAIKHGWAKHPILLRFPPHSDHPDGFVCDICEDEEEIDPNLWIYYSTDPDVSFHTRCAPRICNYPNMRFGDMVEVSSHSHPLKFIEKATLKSSCDDCGKDISSLFAFECEDCNFCLCRVCLKMLVDENFEETLDDANFEEKLLKVLLDEDLLHLPASDLSEKLIKRFLLQKNKLTNIQPEIRHWNHEEHPLILFIHEQQNVNDNEIDEDEQILCNCCIEPVSAPYYSCAECSYFLHLPCANLPDTLQHSSHPHPLTLSGYSKFYSTFSCNMCEMISNGLFYMCETCDYFLDVKCAALPTVIKHQHHRHPLLQFKTSSDEEYECNGCDYMIRGLAFGCESCNFYVDFNCATLPRAIKHRLAKHPIPLRFPPYFYHPANFTCGICEEEEEINPRRWIYYSTECNVSFLPRCVPRLETHRNVKFGGIVEVSSHSHPLKFVRKATLKSSCDGCGNDIDYFVFECEDCNFCLCFECLKVALDG